MTPESMRGNVENGMTCFIRDIAKKLTPNEAHIVIMAAKYNFYPKEVLMTLAVAHNGVVDENHKKMTCRTHVLTTDGENETMGFYIIFENEDAIQLKFYFLKPEYRHKGTFSRWIKKEQGGSRKISACVSNNHMVKALSKAEFKFKRVCDDKKTVLFVWNEK